MKLSWLNIFREYGQKLQIKSRTRIVLVLKSKAHYYHYHCCYYYHYALRQIVIAAVT